MTGPEFINPSYQLGSQPNTDKGLPPTARTLTCGFVFFFISLRHSASPFFQRPFHWCQHPYLVAAVSRTGPNELSYNKRPSSDRPAEQAVRARNIVR